MVKAEEVGLQYWLVARIRSVGGSPAASPTGRGSGGLRCRGASGLIEGPAVHLPTQETVILEVGVKGPPPWLP